MVLIWTRMKHDSALFQLLEAEQQAAQLQEKARELEVCLETTRLQLREKDAHLEEQKRKERELLTTVTECVEAYSPRNVPSAFSKTVSCWLIFLFFFCHTQHAAAGSAGPGGWSKTALPGSGEAKRREQQSERRTAEAQKGP